MRWVNEYIQAINEALGAMDFATIEPFSHYQFEPLFAKEFVQKISMLIDEAEKQKVSPKELGKLWHTTTGIRCQLFFLVQQLKCAHTPKKERERIANFFHEMFKDVPTKDVFGRKSNICKSEEQIAQMLKKQPLEKADPVIAKQLGRLYNALYNLCAGIYLDFYLDSCGENEGPYDVSNIYGPGHILVIKKFVHMKTPMWPDLKLPYNNIAFYTVYKGVEYKSDMVSVHSVYKGDVINGLKAYGVLVDGKMMSDLQEIKQLTNEMSVKSVEQWQRLKALNREEQKQVGLEIKLYVMKEVFKKVGMDWKPTKEMIAAVKNKPFKEESYWNIPQDEKKQREYWKKLYDPQVDFYPGDSLN